MKKSALLILLSMFFAACYPNEDQPGEYDEPVTVNYKKCEGTVATGNYVTCVKDIIIIPNLEEARDKARAYAPDLQFPQCTSMQIGWDSLPCENKSVTIP